MSAQTTQALGEGVVIRVQGPVIDVEFHGAMPGIHEALRLQRKGNETLMLETEFILDNGEVRTLAMGPTEGVQRGDRAVRTGAPISVPIGEKTLGRIFDVLGRTIDDGPQLTGADVLRGPIHREPPALSEQKSRPEMLETGIKVIDLDCAVHARRQDRHIRRRGRREDRHRQGAHPQHRHRAPRLFGLCRRR